MSLLDGKNFEMVLPPIWMKDAEILGENSLPFDGCVFCMDNIFINEETKEFEMIVETEWKHQHQPMGDFIMPINYCPKCGLKLK